MSAKDTAIHVFDDTGVLTSVGLGPAINGEYGGSLMGQRESDVDATGF